MPQPATNRAIALSCLGVFVFYVAHDFFQERAFRTPGYKFGWFMTLVEIAMVSGGALAFEWRPMEATREAAAKEAVASKYIVALAAILTVAQGTGSAALVFVNFPIKVGFKSSKLCPTMVFGVLFTGKRYSGLECLAALLMCASLAMISLADARFAVNTAASENVALGCALLTVATFSDALIPNLQEKVLKELQYPVGRMIVLSNLGCLAMVFAYTLLTGELSEALAWCSRNTFPASLLLAQAACSYAGLRCYLHVIKELSGVAGVILTSMRKVLTLILSFLIFEKPFHQEHARAFCALAAGVALASYSTSKKKKQAKTALIDKKSTDDDELDKSTLLPLTNSIDDKKPQSSRSPQASRP